MKNRKNQSGFTIIELLIVVVVIGILATLVIVTYSGIQMKNRDTKRKNDVEAIGMQLEVYNATTGSYPALHELQDSSWATANLKNFNSSHLVAPGSKFDSISNIISTKTYQYVPGPEGCTTSKRNCSTFTLTAKLEAGNTQPVVVRNVSN